MEVTYKCNSCLQQGHYAAERYGLIVKKAEEEGWSIGRSRMLCPDCAKYEGTLGGLVRKIA